jgi:hypothetical protein
LITRKNDESHSASAISQSISIAATWCSASMIASAGSRSGFRPAPGLGSPCPFVILFLKLENLKRSDPIAASGAFEGANNLENLTFEIIFKTGTVI